ncbi:MAG TPA: helix-turn-helix domain-containing protein [Solirubrobacterales bacterium]|nr:helix-turn-helix domain-containing protein [Solirubrobacterales bacterium]
MAVLSRREAGASERRREAVQGFLVATEELLDHGASYAELSVEQISSRAGRPRTAFYLYFRDKRELLMRLTEGVAQTLYEEANRWWSGSRGRDDLEPALADIVHTWGEHASVLRAIVEASTYDAEIARFWRELVGRFVEATERRLVEEGEEPGSAAAKAFVLCWMVVEACYQQLARGESLDDPALLAALTDIMGRGVYR